MWSNMDKMASFCQRIDLIEKRITDGADYSEATPLHLIAIIRLLSQGLKRLEQKNEALLLEVRSELGCALSQMTPKDDQIIFGHVRNAYCLLDGLNRNEGR